MVYAETVEKVETVLSESEKRYKFINERFDERADYIVSKGYKYISEKGFTKKILTSFNKEHTVSSTKILYMDDFFWNEEIKTLV
jgi:hypothetical protein